MPLRDVQKLSGLLSYRCLLFFVSTHCSCCVIRKACRALALLCEMWKACWAWFHDPWDTTLSHSRRSALSSSGMLRSREDITVCQDTALHCIILCVTDQCAMCMIAKKLKHATALAWAVIQNFVLFHLFNSLSAQDPILRYSFIMQAFVSPNASSCSFSNLSTWSVWVAEVIILSPFKESSSFQEHLAS